MGNYRKMSVSVNYCIFNPNLLKSTCQKQNFQKLPNMPEASKYDSTLF